MSKKTALVLFGLLTISILPFTSRAVGLGVGISAHLRGKSVATDSVTWWVPDNFPTIQEAINSPLVNPGDTIRVRPDVYDEHVVVDKTVSLIGENRLTTIIDGSGTGTVVNVTANDVYFSGFTVRNGDYGICVFGSTNSTVSGNDANGNEWEGIWLDHSTYCVVSENNASNNRWDGIWLRNSTHCTVSRNNAHNNYAYGVIVDYFSSNCIISENNATQNWIGISIEKESHNCMATKNNVNNNEYHGLRIYLSQNCTIVRNNANSNYYYGIHVYFSNGSIISKNTADNNGEGIYLGGSDYCTVYANGLHNNYYGIWFVYSDYCTTVGNTALNNTVGVYLYYSNNTNIYHNNFVNNTNQVEIAESPNSSWDNGYPSGGNYWSDYDGVDDNGDGIGDTPYVINADNLDHYPLMDLWRLHDVAVTDIIAWPRWSVPHGNPVYIDVTVENQGEFAETFDVSVYADRLTGDVHIDIETRTVTLDIGESKLLEFEWGTTGVPPGNYLITAEAILPGDVEPEDNKARAYIGGIFPPHEQPSIDIFALLLPTVSAAFICIALGIAAVGFLKIFSSSKLLRLWRSQRHYLCKIH